MERAAICHAIDWIRKKLDKSYVQDNARQWTSDEWRADWPQWLNNGEAELPEHAIYLPTTDIFGHPMPNPLHFIPPCEFCDEVLWNPPIFL